MKSVLLLSTVLVLFGCATPLTMKTPDLSDARVDQCVREAPARLAKAERGDRAEQYNVGKNMFNGCAAGRVKNIDEALAWLEKSANQGDLSANAFLGGVVYSTRALQKHQAEQDWTDDEQKAAHYTDTALAIWEKGQRSGFNSIALAQLQVAVNDRGLLQRRIHDDRTAAFESYCFVQKIGPLNAGAASDLTMNLAEIGKTKADCAK